MNRDSKASRSLEGEHVSPSFSKCGVMKGRFHLIVLLELLFLAVLLLLSAVTPGHTFIIGAQDFDAAANARSEDGVLVLEPVAGSAAESVMLFTGGYALRPGAYEIRIDYRLDTDAPKDFYRYCAMFLLDSSQRITTEPIKLSETLTQAHGRIWTPLGLKGTNVMGALSYEGGGTLTIKRIAVMENVGYRFVCIAGLALLMLLLNAAYLLFFSCRAQLPAWAGTAAVMAGIVFAACLPYLTDFVYESHDIAFHLKRIVSLAEELRYGQFPVRMHTTVNNGYGYPLSLYYGDLLLYLPAILYCCAVPLQTCYQIYTFAINALTCVIAYACLHGMTKRRALSLLGAALYTLSMYRLSNIYARAAVGEYTALVFMPLALLGVYRICEAERPALRDWLPLCLGMTGVTLSHMLSTEMMVFDLALVCLFFLRRMLKKKRLAAVVKAAALCLLLSAWFLVPFADCFLSQQVNIQTVSEGIQYRGAYPVQLMSILPGAFGFSMYAGMQGEAPISIGLPLIAGAAAIAYGMLNRQKWRLAENRTFAWVRVLFAAALLNLVMTLACFPWDALQDALGRLGGVITSLQFPWRWLAVAVPLLVLAVVLMLGLMERADKRAYAVSFAAIVVALVWNVGGFYAAFIDEVPAYSSSVKSCYEASDDLYLPAGTDQEAIRFSECRVTQGEAEIESYAKESGVAAAHVQNDSAQEAQITFPVFAYRGYRAFDGEGNELAISIGENNCIAVTVAPQYAGAVLVRFVPPVLWRIAEAVSLGALVLLLGACAGKRRNS